MGIKRDAGLPWNRLLMRVDNSTGKGTSSMDKFSGKLHGVHMELKGKLLYSLRIKTQFLERLQSVSVVDGATHTQKDDVESKEALWRMLQRSLCCSFVAFSWFWGLVSSQYLISTRWISRRVLLRFSGRCYLGLVELLVTGGAAGMLPVSLNCPLPLRRTPAAE